MASVYELARQVNFRLYDGDESKFPVLLAIIGEIQYRSFGCFSKLISGGLCDEYILRETGLYSGSELDVMVKLQKYSHYFRRDWARRRLWYKLMMILGLGLSLSAGALLGYGAIKLTNVLRSVLW